MGLDFLAKCNKHHRDSNIDFQDEGHIYTIRHSGCVLKVIVDLLLSLRLCISL